MKIINPNDANHTVKLIPRFYGYNDSSLFFTIYDESTKQTVSIDAIWVLDNGIVTVSFNNNDILPILFIENGTYQITILDQDTDDVVYMGKLLATSQTTQSYKLTEGLYSYE